MRRNPLMQRYVVACDVQRGHAYVADLNKSLSEEQIPNYLE